MSLLDDARRLSERAVRTSGYDGRTVTTCHLCSTARTFWDDQAVEHTADCPCPALPKIVAALEAAEQVLNGIHIFNTADPDGILAEIPHAPRQALVAALRGREERA